MVRTWKRRAFGWGEVVSRRSTSVTERTWWRSTSAAVSPTRPPPTIKTSDVRRTLMVYVVHALIVYVHHEKFGARPAVVVRRDRLPARRRAAQPRAHRGRRDAAGRPGAERRGHHARARHQPGRAQPDGALPLRRQQERLGRSDGRPGLRPVHGPARRGLATRPAGARPLRLGRWPAPPRVLP